MTGLLRLAALPVLLSLLIPATLSGQAGVETEPPRPPRVAARANVEWIAAARWVEPNDTALNAGNLRFRIPQFGMQTELRPHLRVDVGSRVTAIVRPRVLATAQSAWATGVPRANEQDVSADWTELFVNWRPADAVQFTYGLQNFQWGPAELLAPSNRLFHETGVFRDQLYYVRGRHLMRMNLSAGRAWSVVALAELGSNGEEPFVAGERFQRQGQVKVEYSATAGRGYVGATVGGREAGRAWFGEYASVSLTDGLSAYVDASHMRGSRAWYPVPLPGGGATFVRSELEADAWRTLAVAGLRYTFAAGPDARLEYLHQDAGYDSDDFRWAALAAASATLSGQAAPYFSPGLEFTGRRFALASLRLPDLPPQKHLALHGRYLRSLTDRSGVAFFTASLEAADALVIFASASLTHGSETAEFSRLVRAGAVAGTVFTW